MFIVPEMPWIQKTARRIVPEINTSYGDLISELALEKSLSIFGYSVLKNSLICRY